MSNTQRLGRAFTTCYSHGQIQVVEVQVLIRRGLPKIDIIGLPKSMIREGKDRILSALSLLGIEPPVQKILVSLNPGDLPKEGSHFDLPILVALLKAMGILDPQKDQEFAWGELSLDGSLRPIQNTVSHLLFAHSLKARNLIANVDDESISFMRSLTGRNPHCISHAYDLVQAIPEKEDDSQVSSTLMDEASKRILNHWVDEASENGAWNLLKGSPQQFLLWILASLGRHHFLIEGSPGVGKSAWSHALREIQMPLLPDQIVEKFRISPNEATKLKSAHDLLQAPYESPHHSSSMASIVGGGSQNISIGYITRAHRGVLFMDEIAEYSRNVIEALREPLETKTITLGRVGNSMIFPADIQLIGAMNPCPCGNYLSKRQCVCGIKKFYDYQSRISNPMRDRFHLNIHWRYEDFTRESRYDLKRIRRRLLEIRASPIPDVSTIQIPNELNPRQRRKWIEFFISWCRWHEICQATLRDQQMFQEFISYFSTPKSKGPYEQSSYF